MRPYSASQGYCHMDVAARNALLHTNNLVKLSDFGIVSFSPGCPRFPQSHGLYSDSLLLSGWCIVPQTRPVDPETGKFRLQGQLRMAVRWMAPETLGKHPILFSGELLVVVANCLYKS